MNQELRALIEKFGIEAGWLHGEMRVAVMNHAEFAKLSKAEVEELKTTLAENKTQIFAEIAEMEAEKRAKQEEEESHFHHFVTYGLEGITAVIDDRKDIWEQCQKQACQDASAREIFDAYNKHLQKLERKMNTKQEENKEDNSSEFVIVKQEDVQQPAGGEDGIDGWARLTLKSTTTGEVIEMIERNVFDFGHYSFPARVSGDDVFTKESWSETEKAAEAWVDDHGVLPKYTRM